MTDYQSFLFKKYILSSLLYKNNYHPHLPFIFVPFPSKLHPAIFKMTECHSCVLYMNILKLSMPKVYLKFLSSDLYIS